MSLPNDTQRFGPVRLATLALTGPLFAIVAHVDLPLATRVQASVAVGVAALVVSRALAMRDVDVARRMSKAIGGWMFVEALVVMLAVAMPLAMMRTSAAVGLGSALAAAGLWVGGYVVALSRAASSTRQVADEARLVIQVQVSALIAEAALMSTSLVLLQQLRQEALNSGSLSEMFFLPLVAWVPFGMVYLPIARFRVAAVGGHMPSEMLVVASSYYAFMLTPLPAAL